jgi:hypothetical protein
MVVMWGSVLLIVIVKVFVAVVLALSITTNVTEVGLSAVVGVPEITPLELSDSPAGNEPEGISQV